MYLKLTRLQQVGDATTGVLKVDGRPFCETMENSQTLIATGMYPVRMTMSPHFGMILPLIDRVIGRSGIRIHPGNTPEDSTGCILVGEVADAGRRLLCSKSVFLTLMGLLLEAQHEREEIWIEVVDCLPQTLAAQRGYDQATHRGYANELLDQEVVYVFDETTKPIH